MSKRCIHYAGNACIDGSCSVANYDYFMSKGMPEIAKAFADAGNCNECHYYKGCDDCIFAGTDYCKDYQEGLKLDGENKL